MQIIQPLLQRTSLGLRLHQRRRLSRQLIPKVALLLLRGLLRFTHHSTPGLQCSCRSFIALDALLTLPCKRGLQLLRSLPRPVHIFEHSALLDCVTIEGIAQVLVSDSQRRSVLSPQSLGDGLRRYEQRIESDYFLGGRLALSQAFRCQRCHLLLQ